MSSRESRADCSRRLSPSTVRCAASACVARLDGLHRLLGGLAPEVAELHLVGARPRRASARSLSGCTSAWSARALTSSRVRHAAGVTQLDLGLEALPVGLPVALPRVELLLRGVAGDGLDGGPDLLAADVEAPAGRVGVELLEPLAVPTQDVGVGVDRATEAAQVVADQHGLLVAPSGARRAARRRPRRRTPPPTASRCARSRRRRARPCRRGAARSRRRRRPRRARSSGSRSRSGRRTGAVLLHLELVDQRPWSSRVHLVELGGDLGGLADHHVELVEVDDRVVDRRRRWCGTCG